MFALKPRRMKTPVPAGGLESPFGWLPEEFSTLFNRFFAPFPVVPEPEDWPFYWGLKLEEKEKELFVRVELPGFVPEEIKIELFPERMTIEAEHKEPPAKPEEKAELAYTHFKRVITLPAEIEVEKAEAVYRNGVLEVRIPRKPEAVGRRIEVKI